VEVKASSLNYRDLSTVEDPEPRGVVYPLVPNSDCAGIVRAVGEGVSGVSVGERVASCFFQRWEDGAITPEAMANALGGTRDGVLAEQVVLEARGVVPVPRHLDFEQAATLPCAALTAWNAVAEFGCLKPGQRVLLLGTGGVSVFALQFATLLGARPIMISSSDEKLQAMRAMGVAETVNYRARPDWHEAVLEVTDGEGVDLVVEVGGSGTLERSIASTRVAGRIALIGVLAQGTFSAALINRKSICLQGIYVGSRAMFRRMNAAVEAARLEPLIHQRFSFDQARDAFHCMRAAGHVGKLTISV
jgi:NADPH:quinone reductase-like Zn-dependent oxidoreductase